MGFVEKVGLFSERNLTSLTFFFWFLFQILNFELQFTIHYFV
jgi:hypothetical protein